MALLDNLLKQVRQTAENSKRQIDWYNAYTQPAGRGLTGEASYNQDNFARVGDPRTPDGAPAQPYNEYLRQSIASTNANAPAPVSRTQAIGASAPMSGSMGSTGGTVMGGSGASPSPTMGPPDTGEARTEFGKLFKPEAWNDAWADPQAVINTYLGHVGQPTNTGGAAMTQQLADTLGILWLLTAGDENVMEGAPNYLDWSGQHLDQMRTPGATAPGIRDVLGSMMGQDDKSLVYQNLYGNDMSAGQQVDQFLRTMRYGLKTSTPSPILDALLAVANQYGEDFRSAAMTGEPGVNFGKYLRDRGFAQGMY